MFSIGRRVSEMMMIMNALYCLVQLILTVTR